MKLLKIDVDLYNLKCTPEEVEELERYIDDNDLVEMDIEIVDTIEELNFKKALKTIKEFE